jgi:site-specific recombinase XerD
MLPATIDRPSTAVALPADPASPVDVYLYSMAEGSRRTMREALATLARLISGDKDMSAYAVLWHTLRYQQATALRAALAERYAHTTANKVLSALRGVLKACWQMGLMSAEDYHLARSVKPVVGSRLPAGREIGQGELVALLRDCIDDTTVLGRRDAAILALLYGCGVRREELATIELGHLNADDWSLRIQGKRNKERLVYVADSGAQAAVSDWLAVRCEDASRLSQEAGAPLFVRILKGGRLTDDALTAKGVNSLLAHRAELASVPHLTPHDFRRTFAGDLLSAGADLATVSKLMGHANVTTTARYDRRPEEAKRAAASLLRVPYRR